MRRTFIIAALLAASPAAAQVTVPAYRNTAGQLQESQGVVVLNPDGTTGGIPQRSTSTSTPGTVTAGGAFQSALAANANRKGCAIYNKSVEQMLVFLGAPGGATAAAAIPLPAGGSFNCGSFQGIVLTDQISLTSATAGSAFVVVSQ